MAAPGSAKEVSCSIRSERDYVVCIKILTWLQVVGGGGESMADPEDVESLPEAEEKLDAAPLVNGISNHTDEKVRPQLPSVKSSCNNSYLIGSKELFQRQLRKKELDLKR